MDKEEKRRQIASLSGRIGASARIAKPGYSGKEATKAATAGSQAAREKEVDPDGVLAEEERQRRAKHLFLARMNRGKLKKLRARRGPKEPEPWQEPSGGKL